MRWLIICFATIDVVIFILQIIPKSNYYEATALITGYLTPLSNHIKKAIWREFS